VNVTAAIGSIAYAPLATPAAIRAAILCVLPDLASTAATSAVDREYYLGVLQGSLRQRKRYVNAARWRLRIFASSGGGDYILLAIDHIGRWSSDRRKR
jgi:hypothetical protein